jgi:hypothetical protein
MRKRPALDWLSEQLARPIDKESCLLWPFSVNIRKPYRQVFFEGKNRIATRVAATNLRDAAGKGRLGWYNIKTDALAERVRDLAAHRIGTADIAGWLQVTQRHIQHILSGNRRKEYAP